MLDTVLLVAILLVLVGILTAVKAGFNEVMTVIIDSGRMSQSRPRVAHARLATRT